MTDLWIGFLLGIVAAFFAEFMLYLFKAEFYDKFLLRRKYRKLTGLYTHENGEVEIVHITGNRFEARGIESWGFSWISNLQYHNNSLFTGVYDWNVTSETEIWGEHYLHVLPNGDISVIWNDRNQVKTGRLIWKKSGSASEG